MKPAWKGHTERSKGMCKMQLCAPEGDSMLKKLYLLVQFGSLWMLHNVLGNGDLALIAT